MSNENIKGSSGVKIIIGVVTVVVIAAMVYYSVLQINKYNQINEDIEYLKQSIEINKSNYRILNFLDKNKETLNEAEAVYTKLIPETEDRSSVIDYFDNLLNTERSVLNKLVFEKSSEESGIFKTNCKIAFLTDYSYLNDIIKEIYENDRMFRINKVITAYEDAEKIKVELEVSYFFRKM